MEKQNKQSAIPSTYQALKEKAVSVYKGNGQDPKHGHMLYKEESRIKPIEQVETDLLNDTDRLICALDGSMTEGKCFLDGTRRFDTPVDGAIYLDKSARPVRALVHELWSDISDGKEPISSFLNIDKEKWLYAIGYTPKEFKTRYLPSSKLDIDDIDSDYLKKQTARIRSLYLDDEAMERAEQLIKDVDSGESIFYTR